MKLCGKIVVEKYITIHLGGTKFQLEAAHGIDPNLLKKKVLIDQAGSVYFSEVVEVDETDKHLPYRIAYLGEVGEEARENIWFEARNIFVVTDSEFEKMKVKAPELFI